ncbi:hypothetical protein AB1Y20_011293 [Prymnesium parvum]|uniref:Ion transport domain-containing protein n=1 Tax=Prymnesium parvum TaxID=97485 RepID=A0AB34IP70_PRYPA
MALVPPDMSRDHIVFGRDDLSESMNSSLNESFMGRVEKSRTRARHELSEMSMRVPVDTPPMMPRRTKSVLLPKELSSERSCKKMTNALQIRGKSPSSSAAIIAAKQKETKESIGGLFGYSYSRWLIDPRTSRRVGYWDAVTALALVFTALVTPFEVALLDSNDVSTLFIVNRVVDMIFVIDIVLQFFLITEKGTGAGHQFLITHRDISINYLKGWFFIDVLSVGVSAFDIVIVMQGDASDLSRVKILRTVRVMRLIKLMRLLRASRIMKRWETRVAINYSILTIFKCVVQVVFVSHFMACIWCLQATMQDDRMHTWLGVLGYCEPAVDDTGRVILDEFDCRDAPGIYSAAIYWSVMTITSIGYGDIKATTGNAVEQLVATVLMLSGAMLWGQVIGTFCGVIAAFNPETTVFHRTMDDLNRFMSRESIPAEMQRRLREYFHQSQYIRLTELQRRLLAAMPPSLKGEVSWQTNKAWLQNVSFLKGATHVFMLEMAHSMNAIVFAPSDLVPRGYLYVVQKGVALYGVRVMFKGSVWGEDMLVANPKLRHPMVARAMNYLAVNYISRFQVLEIAERHPDVKKKLKRAAVFMALRREIILRARFYQSSNDSPSSKFANFCNMLMRGHTARFGNGASLVFDAAAEQGARHRDTAAAVDEGVSLSHRGEQSGTIASVVGASRDDLLGLQEKLMARIHDVERQVVKNSARQAAEIQRGLELIRESQAQSLAELAQGIASSLSVATGSTLDVSVLCRASLNRSEATSASKGEGHPKTLIPAQPLPSVAEVSAEYSSELDA